MKMPATAQHYRQSAQTFRGWANGKSDSDPSKRQMRTLAESLEEVAAMKDAATRAAWSEPPKREWASDQPVAVAALASGLWHSPRVAFPFRHLPATRRGRVVELPSPADRPDCREDQAAVEC